MSSDPYQEYVAGKILVPDTHTAQVPEPTALALMGLGLIGLGVSRLKKESLA